MWCQSCAVITMKWPVKQRLGCRLTRNLGGALYVLAPVCRLYMGVTFGRRCSDCGSVRRGFVARPWIGSLVRIGFLLGFAVGSLTGLRFSLTLRDAFRKRRVDGAFARFLLGGGVKAFLLPLMLGWVHDWLSLLYGHDWGAGPGY